MHPIEPDASPEIMELISAGMSSRLHWFLEDVPPAQLAETLVGMANTEGGAVLIGISPSSGELVGIRDPQSVHEKVFQAAILSDPTLVLPMARQVMLQHAGVHNPISLMVINVPSGLPHVYCLDGRYLGREGSHTDPLSAPRLYRLLTERGSIQFDSRLVPEAYLDDLDSQRVMHYAQAVGSVPAGDLPACIDFLVKRGCLRRVDNDLKVTYAGLLLFGQAPQQWLPSATILAGRFPGLAMSDTYIKREIIGNLLEQLTQAEDFVRSNLRTAVRLVNFKHQEIPEYPLEAIRELIINAVAHRDYNLQGDNIHLNIYSDRLVVSSPGTLPGPVTLENLLEARFARNAIISQVLSDLGYVERLGYGLDRVLEVTRQEGLLPPLFEEAAGTFRVTLFASQPVDAMAKGLPDLSLYSRLELNPRQQLVLTQLAIHPRFTSHEYQALCPDVHAETLRRDLADLVSRGILIKVGDKKATYYILK